MSGGGDDLFGPYSRPDHDFSSYNPAPPPFSPPQADNTLNLGPAQGFDLNNPYGTSCSASAHGGMVAPSHGYAGYGGPMSAATPQGGTVGASQGYSGYGGPSGFYQMSYHAGGLQMPQPARHSTSSISGFAGPLLPNQLPPRLPTYGGPYASGLPNQIPPMAPSYGTYGEGSSHGGRLRRSHASSPSWHPPTAHDEEMSSAAPRHTSARISNMVQQPRYLDPEVCSTDHSMPSGASGGNMATEPVRAKWDDKLTEALCHCWHEQDQRGHVDNGKLTSIGSSNLVAACKASTGLPFSKVQLEHRVRAIRKVYAAIKILQSSSRVGRTSACGYVAAQNTWDKIKKLGKEAERLRYAGAQWHDLLHDMFKKSHYDLDSMMKSSATEPISENVESEDTPGGDSIPTGTTSGSRKRALSGATKSTGQSPSKPPVQARSPPSTLQPKTRKSWWGVLFGSIRGQAQNQTESIQQLTTELKKKTEEATQKYDRWLDLAKKAGISSNSDEFVFFTNYLAKNNERQSSFLMCDTHEERRNWITRAFSVFQREQLLQLEAYRRQHLLQQQQQQGNAEDDDSD